jgi:hypothetical protein
MLKRSAMPGHGALAPVDDPLAAERTRIKACVERARDRRVSLSVPLPQATIDQFHKRAALNGISGATLAAMILEIVARDVLYVAVLDAPSWKAPLQSGDR